MNINTYVFFLVIIPATIILGAIIGAFLMSWYLTSQLKKAMGFKSWKEFIQHAQKAQQMQKRMEKEGIFGVMNDPELRKQMEDLQKRFGGKSK